MFASMIRMTDTPGVLGFFVQIVCISADLGSSYHKEFDVHYFATDTYMLSTARSIRYKVATLDDSRPLGL